MPTPAYNIAVNELRACYDAQGVLAGKHHFTDYWARDGFFASLGALAIKDYDIVAKQVRLFLNYQRPDGLIPYRLQTGPINLFKYLGKSSRYPSPRPTYRLRGFGPEIYDGTTLAVIIASLLHPHRPLSSGDLTKLHHAFRYLEKKTRRHLLWDGIMAEWNDTAYKFGYLLYTNLLYWYAADRFAHFLSQKKDPLKNQYSRLATTIATSLRQKLWNGSFFADWYDYRRQDYFYPFGNLLAISWGFTTPEETSLILSKAKSAIVDFTLETNTPKYPFWRIDLGHHLIGIGHYQNQSTLWWMPGTTYVAALTAANQLHQARDFLSRINRQILKYQGLHECYHRTGRPFSHLFYRAEHPFAWAAGLYLWCTRPVTPSYHEV